MGIPLRLNQLGLFTILCFWEWCFEVNQIERGEVFTLEVIDKI